MTTGTFGRRGLLRIGGGLAAAAALPGALTACGNGSGSGSGSGKLRVVGVADQKAPLDAMTAAYTKQHKTAFSTTFAPTDQVTTQVRTQLAGGNAPDVHVVYPGNGNSMAMVQLAKAGLLADLSGQSLSKEIPAALNSAFQYEKKTYLYSAGSTVIGAVYNKKVFADAGVEPPKTWAELLEVCGRLKARGVAPIALGAQTPWVTQLITYALVPSTVYAKDPAFDDKMAAGQATFAESGWADAMEMYLELLGKGYFNDNPNGTTFEQQVSMVATGKAAMAVQVSAVLGAFREGSKTPDDIGMFPFPGGDNPQELWLPAGVVVGLGVSARSKNAKDAMAFVEWLGRQENINQWCEAVAAIPVRRDASSKIDPELESFLPEIDADRAVPFMDQRWPNAEVQPVHFAAVQDLLAKKTDVKGALGRMDEAYRKES
ncbi:extracellular solute-binding protein [Streptomyces sp. NPDC051940]|uniref:extracellular solute-binding protein n=1 Tax=Streptomyces sp. NPDC051940 TaxID=3155675 RepID=UPI003432D2AC